jgi:PiT family inorganic phosphate transporter
MTPMLLLVVIIVVISLAFDFVNGMNDAANSIATIVSTRVLSPRIAVLWAAFFNFVAAFGFGVHVATTIGKGIIEISVVDQLLILDALVGAIIWAYLCTHLGIPISISHALVGALAGAGIAKAGFAALHMSGLLKVGLFIVLSPLLGMVLAFIFMVAVLWIFRKSTPRSVDSVFRLGQLLSSAAYSIGHGTNDAQKTMGVIALVLYTSGYLGETFYVPTWVIVSAYAAIALGTYTGGWKVIETMGQKLTQLRPVHGFCAETASAIMLFGTAMFGIPVSTTHTITGAILGVGATRRLSAVRWGIAGRIVWAWILTIPMSAVIAALAYWLTQAVRMMAK